MGGGLGKSDMHVTTMYRGRGCGRFATRRSTACVPLVCAGGCPFCCLSTPCLNICVQMHPSSSKRSFVHGFHGRVHRRLVVKGFCLKSVHPVDSCEGVRLGRPHGSLCACLSITMFFLVGTFLTILNAF